MSSVSLHGSGVVGKEIQKENPIYRFNVDLKLSVEKCKIVTKQNSI